MPRLGTYTTLDCPTDEKATDEAFKWLETQLDLIGGNVRKVINPHDFGSYPSFEIDYPSHLEYAEDDLCEDDDYEDAEDLALSEEKRKWTDKANDLETEFCKLFHNN